MEQSKKPKLDYIIIGNSSVGKTCILNRFIDGTFSEEYQNTIGVEFGSKPLTIDGHSLVLQIWDTAGSENFRSVTRSYYKQVQVAFIVYDVTRKASFLEVKTWLKNCRDNAQRGLVIVLVGNKTDLGDKRKVSAEEGK